MELKKVIDKIKNDPFKIFSYTVGRLYSLCLALDKRVHIGSGFRFFGIPIIDVRGNGKIMIGKNVTLNSRNRGISAHIQSSQTFYRSGRGDD
jgi:hypothetical protein